MSKLPAYEGPARAGDKLPAFTTTRADGSPFTEKNLQSGQPSALVFFRGHT
jgi:cytochrome oxidase Cu insertion factor (SCO1/SenC/PrrC family)